MVQAHQASLWEAAKLEAQSAFRNIGDAYQQIMMTGHLYPSMDRSAFNREIAEASYKTPEQEELFYRNHFPDVGPEQPELEPQR